MPQTRKTVANVKKQEKFRYTENKTKDVCYFAKDISKALGECIGEPGTLNAVTTQPGVLAFILLYSSKPGQNDRRSDTVYATTNLDLLLDSDDTNLYSFNSPVDFVRLKNVSFSKAVFPVFAFRKYRHRWNFSSTYGYLGLRRIASVTYLAPGIREEQQNIDPMEEAQNGWIELLIEEIPETEENNPMRHVTGTPVSIVDSVIKDLRAARRQNFQALWKDHPDMREEWKQKCWHQKIKKEKGRKSRIIDEGSDYDDWIDREETDMKSLKGAVFAERSGSSASRHGCKTDNDESLLIDMRHVEQEAKSEGRCFESVRIGKRWGSMLAETDTNWTGFGFPTAKFEMQNDLLSGDCIPLEQDDWFCEKRMEEYFSTTKLQTEQPGGSLSTRRKSYSNRGQNTLLINLSDSSQDSEFSIVGDSDDDSTSQEPTHPQDIRLINGNVPEWKHISYFKRTTAPAKVEIDTKPLADAALVEDGYSDDRQSSQKKLKLFTPETLIVSQGTKAVLREAIPAQQVKQNDPLANANEQVQRQGCIPLKPQLSKHKQNKIWKKQVWGMDSDSGGESSDEVDEKTKDMPGWMREKMNTEEKIERSMWFRAGCKQTRRGDALRQWERKWELVPEKINERNGKRKVILPSYPRRRNRKNSNPYKG